MSSTSGSLGADFKPMLAGVVNVDTLKYPVLCSPKYDGIRCITRDGQAVSRKLLPIPNAHVQTLLSGLPAGLDGELILEGKTFNQIQSAVMREDGEPDFRFYVFDIVSEKPYDQRMAELAALALPAVCVKVLPVKIASHAELMAYETRCLDAGEEGVMIRSPRGPYKFGRSTEKQGYLLKLKRFSDAEARIIGFEELMHNENEATKNELGHTKRSTKKAGKVAAGTLGSFIVETDDGRSFNVATGMTAEDRQYYWDNRDKFMGALVKYKFQEVGAKDLPRFPVFLGIRSEIDM